MLLWVLTPAYWPLAGYKYHQPDLASRQSHFLHLQSPISSVSTSTFPPAMRRSMKKLMTQLKHAGAQKCELVMSGELPAKQWMMRVSIHQNDISEGAHLDQLFQSHCPRQDISILQFLNPTFPSHKQTSRS